MMMLIVVMDHWPPALSCKDRAVYQSLACFTMMASADSRTSGIAMPKTTVVVRFGLPHATPSCTMSTTGLHNELEEFI